jgi:hypothetical protein
LLSIATVGVLANETHDRVAEWLGRVPRYGGLTAESQIVTYENDLARWIDEGRRISDVATKLVDYATVTKVNDYQEMVIIMALGHLSDGKVGIKFLEKCLSVGVNSSRKEAAVALGRIGNSQSIAILCKEMRTCDIDEVGMTILSVLYRSDTANARQCLRWVAANGKTEEIRKDAKKLSKGQ